MLVFSIYVIRLCKHYSQLYPVINCFFLFLHNFFFSLEIVIVRLLFCVLATIPEYLLGSVFITILFSVPSSWRLCSGVFCAAPHPCSPRSPLLSTVTPTVRGWCSALLPGPTLANMSSVSFLNKDAWGVKYFETSCAWKYFYPTWTLNDSLAWCYL